MHLLYRFFYFDVVANDYFEFFRTSLIALNLVRDSSGKPGAKKCQFSQAKKATKESSFWVEENGVFCEDFQRIARPVVYGGARPTYSSSAFQPLALSSIF
ncbi:hypothetical protein B0I10_11516 [Flavobacterium lacus]|uniref:Uncharacterized protein n=1 Tax=Flavobacterium lacus TaxID=1353778 RepID=A0A328WV18_9FLAO|nr:hypothetical protein B0I10_11516 [Flavobacterium lacus]